MSSPTEYMWVLIKGEGPLVVNVESEDDKSLIGSYWNAVQQYLDTGSVEALVEFDGVTVGIGEHELETDPGEIEYWARAGELDFTDIYHGAPNA